MINLHWQWQWILGHTISSIEDQGSPTLPSTTRLISANLWNYTKASTSSMVPKIATPSNREQPRWTHPSSHRNLVNVRSNRRSALHKASPNNVQPSLTSRKRHQSSDIYSMQKLQPQPASSSNRYGNNGARARTPKK